MQRNDVTEVNICEIFSPERVCARCELHGLVPGSSFDVHTGYDLGRYAVQREFEKAIDEEDPDFLIGSPPCTKFSITDDNPENFAATPPL